MCDPKTTRTYCCTKPNWIGSSRLWNNRPRPHSLGLLAYTFAARKQIAGRYFRGKLFSREDIFVGRYFRLNRIFAKISSRENISNSLFAKISSRENKVLYSTYKPSAKLHVRYFVSIRLYTIATSIGLYSTICMFKHCLLFVGMGYFQLSRLPSRRVRQL